MGSLGDEPSNGLVTAVLVPPNGLMPKSRRKLEGGGRGIVACAGEAELGGVLDEEDTDERGDGTNSSGWWYAAGDGPGARTDDSFSSFGSYSTRVQVSTGASRTGAGLLVPFPRYSRTAPADPQEDVSTIRLHITVAF